MKIFLPTSHAAERRYTTEAILVEMLGFKVEMEFCKIPHPLLVLENGRRLVLEDHFFSLHIEPLSWLTAENLPRQVFFQKKSENPFQPEEDLPLIFGNEKMEVAENQIVCGVDVFASAFFMLTRWEEFVNPARDAHGRFPAKASLAGQFNFLHRPVVNELAEMVWNMLLHLGCSVKRKPHQFEFLLTHDVDMPRLWRSFPLFVKKLGGDLLKRRSLREFSFSLRTYAATRWDGRKDPFNTFGYLMDCADRSGLQSHFFFLCGGNSKFDQAMPPDSPLMRELLDEIQRRGHVIGIHPSYNSLNDSDLFKQEKKRLEQATGFPVKIGRQHFLRFEAPATWQMWEDSGMAWDSTMGYPEQAGFRCGTCQPFRVFNFLTRKKLNLLEKPLMAMDTTFAIYQKAAPEKAFQQIVSITQTVKKYGGTFVLLWHNSSFNQPDYLGYRQTWESVLEEISAQTHLASTSS